MCHRHIADIEAMGEGPVSIPHYEKAMHYHDMRIQKYADEEATFEHVHEEAMCANMLGTMYAYNQQDEKAIQLLNRAHNK